jgi:hypothetical protein
MTAETRNRPSSLARVVWLAPKPGMAVAEMREVA